MRWSSSAASSTGEGQVVGADVGEVTGDPEPVQPQHRVCPRGQYQPELRRLLFEQLADRLQHPAVLDQVEVVQDQGDDLGQLGESGPDQQRFPGTESRGGRHLPKRAATWQGANDPQRAQDVGPKCR